MYHYRRYIARHLLYSTLLIAFSLTAIVWLTQALRFIDFIVNQGVSITVFLHLTVLLVPSLIFMILPPALFCAVLFIYNKLKLDSELVVMQAAGLSKWRLAIPALQVSAIIMVLGYLIAFYILPVSYRNFRDMQSFLRNNYVSILLQEGVFSNPVEGLMVYIRERDDNNILHGIMVHDSRVPGAQVTMMAEEGKMVETPQGPRFLLKNGNRQEMQQGKLSFLNFESYTLDISLYTQAMRDRIIDPQELFIGDLFSYDDSISPADNFRRFAEGHQRLLWPAYSVCLTMIAMAILLSGEFNRRGHWKRVSITVAIGVILLFSAIGLRGAIALTPGMTVLAYLNLFLPILASSWALSYEPKRLQSGLSGQGASA